MKKKNICIIFFIPVLLVIQTACNQKKSESFCSNFQQILTKADEKKLTDIRGEKFESKIYGPMGSTCTALLPGAMESMIYPAPTNGQDSLFGYLAVMSVSKDQKEAEKIYMKTSKQIKDCVASIGLNVEIYDKYTGQRPPAHPDDKMMGFLYKNLLINLTCEYSDITNQYICTLYISPNEPDIK